MGRGSREAAKAAKKDGGWMGADTRGPSASRGATYDSPGQHSVKIGHRAVPHPWAQALVFWLRGNRFAR
jgi:hypothetical protein